MNKRAIIIVLDSVGIGELPDADKYGDKGANTIGNLYKNIPGFSLPNMEKMGLGNISGIDYIPKSISPTASFAKMAEASHGKDTTTGHWEIAGLRLDKPFSVFPNGFPNEIIDKFKEITGYDVLCNKPYSGTEVIKDYGIEHMTTKRLIVYTSADSVFQIAAHEEVVPLEELYDICRKARKMLDPYFVGRVIARPFVGNTPQDFKRTPNRRDFSLEPFSPTLLDNVKAEGLEVAAVGKIEDIYAAKGITQSVHTVSNADGINKTIDYLKTVKSGLIFTNLVDFDMLYGHRNDANGYANALIEFDNRLPEILSLIGENDLLFITADHGCDPFFTESTDHSREYVPLLVYSPSAKCTDLGIRNTFSDLGATAAEFLNAAKCQHGKSFLNEIM